MADSNQRKSHNFDSYFDNNRAFVIDHADVRSKPRRGNRMVKLFFTLIFGVVIASAIWLFVFSGQGFYFGSHSDPTKQLSAGSAAPETLPFVGVAFQNVTVSLEQGGMTMLRPKFELPPESQHINTRTLKLHWVSENPGVATVDQHGTVKARGIGNARIVVSIDNDDIDSNAAYCLVSVSDREGVNFTSAGYDVPQGLSQPLNNPAPKAGPAKSPTAANSTADRADSHATASAEKPVKGTETAAQAPKNPAANDAPKTAQTKTDIPETIDEKVARAFHGANKDKK